MGWFGMSEHVEHTLEIVGADKNDQGEFLIVGKAPISFLGLGGELVIDDEVMYLKDRQTCSLASLMNNTSYGVRGVTII